MANSVGDSSFALTPEVHKGIVAAIRAGAFMHVAAEANGISYRTFAAYMSESFRDKYSTDHHAAIEAFQKDVKQAAAQARMGAEIAVRKAKPFEWLRFGPGRDKGKDNPGWTDPTQKVELTGKDGGPIAHTVAAAIDLSALNEEDMDGLERLAAKLAGGRAGGATGGAG